jgi:glycosyltransferase involved in cell wall biosynthesis
MREIVPVIIPAYEPDENMISLLRSLRDQNIGPVIVVDDGSGEAYSSLFEKAESIVREDGGVLLTHEVNRGKGAALKTAFSYILEKYPDAIGSVTADSDGQHTADAISNVKDTLIKNPGSLILGVRMFDGEDVPWRRRFGNNLTVKVFSLVTGLHVSDTQTGLRGIPLSFMRELLDVPGDRFEFETRMLIKSAKRYPVVEIKIETIYDSKDNHKTHFRPVADSIKIYRVLFETFGKYIFASLSSFLIDILLFQLFFNLLRGNIASSAAVATVAARVISATYNYIMNYKVVFKSREPQGRAAVKYLILAVAQMVCSAGLVTLGTIIFSSAPAVVIKIIVDTLLFLISYLIQKHLVFRE